MRQPFMKNSGAAQSPPPDICASILSIAEKHRKRRAGARVEYIEASIIDYEILSVLLKKPEQDYDAIAMSIVAATDFHVYEPLDTVKRRLRSWEIFYPERRILWAGKMQNQARLFREFLSCGREEAGEKRDELRRVLTGIRYRHRINYTAIMMALLDGEESTPWAGALREVVRTLDSFGVRSLIWELVDAVAMQKGLSVKRSVQEEIKDVQEFLRDSLRRDGMGGRGERREKKYGESGRRSRREREEALGKERTDDTDSTSELVEQLEQNLEDCRTAFEFTQAQIETLEGRIEEMREEAWQEAVVSFFQDMNSDRAGRLLDQFSLSEKGLKRLRKSGFSFPMDAESIPASVRMFMSFLSERGINQITEVGNTFRITLADSDGYSYQGSDFTGEDDEKSVEVIRPGWEYRGRVISKPLVREVS